MSDYETIQRNRNMTVGIFVLMAMGAFVWLIFKFGDLPLAVTRLRAFDIYVQFSSAPGVQRDTPVRFCGYEIGRVTDIRPPKILRDMKTNQFYYQSIIVLSIDKKYNNIPADVDIKLMTRGLGSSYIEILAKPETFDPNRLDAKFLVDKIMIQGSTGVASEFFPPESQQKLELLVEDLSVLIRSANDILGDKQNQENVKMALGNLSKASNQAAGAVEEFKKFFAEATYTSEELSKTVSQLRIILEKINSGEGTAGMLVNDGRLYEKLLENTEQLKMLLEDLKAFVKESSDKGVPIKLK